MRIYSEVAYIPGPYHGRNFPSALEKVKRKFRSDLSHFGRKTNIEKKNFAPRNSKIGNRVTTDEVKQLLAQ